MPQSIHDDIIDLHYKLTHADTKDPKIREEISELATKINEQLAIDELTHEPSADLVEEIELAATEFEQEHPNVSALLKNILLTLQNIGI